MKLIIALFTALVLTGCIETPSKNAATSALPPSQLIVVTQSAPPHPELQWFRTSAERRAVYEQTYRAAASAASTASAGLQLDSWAVVLDVDETVLDNSEYQVRRVVSGQGYSDDTWNAWVHDQQAVALAGAKKFIDTVKDELHGQVVLVTNRSVTVCSDTENNLRAQQIRFDQILCAPVDSNGKTLGDKNPRFKQVQLGDPARNIRPLKVILYVGDNIQDFPGLTQGNPGDYSRFGVDFFVLPNPVYGSWEKNIYR